ncbi:hypothetical protein DS745_03710 [Anaerobacillus alkaliphilus]|uniref:Uncharacterized protein n=1 Tax=Anaerobacillus alkaliphilus TaxID=1548597 RepID=A0A4Q0VYF8_9BACI|nr:DUF6366 family protein [Anaerobacillus alkaliphilus]RXJ04500.1 hypothetical protein DS745_03710 [Anaerobacillus alkaliphilus]
MSQDEQDKMRVKDWERHPTANVADSVNRSMAGDPGALMRGGCLTKIVTLILLIVGFLLVTQCSNVVDSSSVENSCREVGEVIG